MSRIIVVGAGLAGLSAALMAREAGHAVTVVTKGYGGQLLSTGALDVFGWRADGSLVDDPFAEVEAQKGTDHPYAVIGAGNVRHGLKWLMNGPAAPLEFRGADKNVLVPTSVGATRPTWAVPAAMHDSVLRDGEKVLVLGIDIYKDLPARLASDNLNRSQYVGLESRFDTLQLAGMKGEQDDTSTTLAHLADEDSTYLTSRIRAARLPGETVLIPSMLGQEPDTFKEIREHAGGPIGEVVGPPPSMGSRRLHEALVWECRRQRVDVQLNTAALGVVSDGSAVTALRVQRAGRVTEDRVDAIIHAPGGFESGGLARDSYGKITEPALGLYVDIPGGAKSEQLQDELSIFKCGVRVNEQMQPLDADGNVAYTNVHLAGDVIAGALPFHELSGEGISLGSAWAAAQALGA